MTTCPHCRRLGRARHVVHAGDLCVRLVDDHADRLRSVDGVSFRPVDLVVNGTPRLSWVRVGCSPMDADDLVAVLEADAGGGAGGAGELLVEAVTPRRRPSPADRRPDPPRVNPSRQDTSVSDRPRVVPSLGPTW